MAFFDSRRAFQSSPIQGSDSHGERLFDAQRPAFAAVPLNCMPYNGPSPPYCPAGDSTSEIDSEVLLGDEPAMVFLPSGVTTKEWNNILAATQSGVALTGSAVSGKMGPVIGLRDVAESVDFYMFRVSLPGVTMDENFRFAAEPNGKISIMGVTATGEKTVRRNSMLFQMQSQNLGPPGEFSISFQLPGPIDAQQLDGVLSNGIFEGVVKKSLPAFR